MLLALRLVLESKLGSLGTGCNGIFGGAAWSGGGLTIALIVPFEDDIVGRGLMAPDDAILHQYIRLSALYRVNAWMLYRLANGNIGIAGLEALLY